MDSWLINLGTIIFSIGAAFAVVKNRVDRLEKDREKDAADIQGVARASSERANAIAADAATRYENLDARMRDHHGNIYQGIDEIRNAGGILESRVSAIETSMQPEKIHEFNRNLGASEARLSRAEQDIQRVETHLLETIRAGCTCKTCKESK